MARPETVPDGVMDGFSYFEHISNVATALEVTRYLDIADEEAIKGMHAVTPDPGACAWSALEIANVRLEFFSIFAANDPDSTREMWERVGLSQDQHGPVVALLNLRADRVDRSRQFEEILGRQIHADWYWLIGDANRGTIRRFEKRLGSRFRDLSGTRVEDVIASLAVLDSRRVRIGGIGNIAGAGHQVVQAFFDTRGKHDC